VRLYLIRHGQTPANVAGELDTAPPGADLTALGRALVGALSGVELAAVHASPAVRTQQTAAPLADSRSLDVIVTDGLQEVAAGDLEMRSDQEAVESYLGCLAAWMLGDRDRRMPGGETGHEFVARFGDAVLRLVAGRRADDTVIAFSHGAAIRTFTALTATGVDAAAISQQRMLNTGGVLLDGDRESGWRLLDWSAEPLGGADLEDATAHDVTGETAGEALADAD
jgi:probable phosphoglycerate mutase